MARRKLDVIAHFAYTIAEEGGKTVLVGFAYSGPSDVDGRQVRLHVETEASVIRSLAGWAAYRSHPPTTIANWKRNTSALLRRIAETVTPDPQS